MFQAFAKKHNLDFNVNYEVKEEEEALGYTWHGTCIYMGSDDDGAWDFADFKVCVKNGSWAASVNNLGYNVTTKQKNK